MIYVQNGKLTLSGVSFALPDGFALGFYGGEDALTFTRDDGAYIELGAEESARGAKDIIVDLLGEDGPYLQAGELRSVSRAGLCGVAVFAYEKENGERYYDERYALKDGRQFYIVIGEKGENLSGACETLLARTEIATWLQSVRAA